MNVLHVAVIYTQTGLQSLCLRKTCQWNFNDYVQKDSKIVINYTIIFLRFFFYWQLPNMLTLTKFNEIYC